MELILAKNEPIQVENTWDPWWEGELSWVNSLKEISMIDNFISYNNVLSQTPTVEENDWELQISIEVFKELEFKIGDWIYIPESEFGGLIDNIERNDEVIKLSGPNFRGYLAKHIITPAISKGSRFEDYISTTNQEANSLLWGLWGLDHSVVSVQSRWADHNVIGLKESSGLFITDQWRFVNYLSGVTRSLKNVGARLETKHVYIDYENINNSEFYVPDFRKGEQAYVFCMAAKPITDYSKDDLFSQDYDIRINSGHLTQNKRKYLWLLGAGEMEEREIVVLENGYEVTLQGAATIGSLWDSDIFDHPNAESREELIKAGQERYFEKNTESKFVEMFVDDSKIEFFLGDIIGGEDFITGISSKAEIVSKELTIADGKQEIRYKIGGK